MWVPHVFSSEVQVFRNIRVLSGQKPSSVSTWDLLTWDSGTLRDGFTKTYGFWNPVWYCQAGFSNTMVTLNTICEQKRDPRLQLIDSSQCIHDVWCTDLGVFFGLVVLKLLEGINCCETYTTACNNDPFNSGRTCWGDSSHGLSNTEEKTWRGGLQKRND